MSRRHDLLGPGRGRPAPPPRNSRPASASSSCTDVVNGGQNEDSWRVHQWFTWPGNQFEPEAQQGKFTQRIQEIATRLGVVAEFAPQAIYQEARIREFIDKAKADALDAVLVVNFWNTLAKASFRIATESAPTAIVYQPVGGNHQLPPEELRTGEGFYYIHSIENWEEIERGLLAVRAKKMLAQSRLLRVAGKPPKQVREPRLEVDIVAAPAEEFNAIFDAAAPDEALVRQAMELKSAAAQVTGVTDEYFVEAMRAHRAVNQIMERYGADAITIECLFLKHRKPCLSFAINNGRLVPCGCENHLDGTLTLMLGRWLLDRGGFLHNPEFDLSENRYFGACNALKLHGPEGRRNTACGHSSTSCPRRPPSTSNGRRANPSCWRNTSAVRTRSVAGPEGHRVAGLPAHRRLRSRLLMEIDRLDDVARPTTRSPGVLLRRPRRRPAAEGIREDVSAQTRWQPGVTRAETASRRGHAPGMSRLTGYGPQDRHPLGRPGGATGWSCSGEGRLRAANRFGSGRPARPAACGDAAPARQSAEPLALAMRLTRGRLSIDLLAHKSTIFGGAVDRCQERHRFLLGGAAAR